MREQTGFQNGYYFFLPTEQYRHGWTRDSYGFLMIRQYRDTCKVHCLLENFETGAACELYATSPSGQKKKLGTISLRQSKNGLWGGEADFTLDNARNLASYDGAHVVGQQTKEMFLEVYANQKRTLPADFFHLPEKPQDASPKENNRPVRADDTLHAETPKQNNTVSAPSEQQQNRTPECSKQYPANKQAEPNRHSEPKQPEHPDEFLAQSLEPYDPFQTTNRSYAWWLCRESVKLKYLLNRFDFRIAPILQEAAEQALSTYQHILVGLYTEQQTQRVFLILAIPSDNETYHVSNQQNVARWVSCTQFYNASGFRGYWLYYFDYRNAALVRAVMRA